MPILNRNYFRHDWKSKQNLDSRTNDFRRIQEEWQLLFLLKFSTSLFLIVFCPPQWNRLLDWFSREKQTNKQKRKWIKDSCWENLLKFDNHFYFIRMIVNCQWNSLCLRVRMNSDFFLTLSGWVKARFFKWSMKFQLYVWLWIFHRILEWVVDILQLFVFILCKSVMIRMNCSLNSHSKQDQEYSCFLNKPERNDVHSTCVLKYSFLFHSKKKCAVIEQ